MCVSLCLHALLMNACVFVCKMLYILYDAMSVCISIGGHKWRKMQRFHLLANYSKKKKKKFSIRHHRQPCMRVRNSLSLCSVLSFYVPLLRVSDYLEKIKEYYAAPYFMKFVCIICEHENTEKSLLL